MRRILFLLLVLVAGIALLGCQGAMEKEVVEDTPMEKPTDPPVDPPVKEHPVEEPPVDDPPVEDPPPVIEPPVRDPMVKTDLVLRIAVVGGANSIRASATSDVGANGDFSREEGDFITIRIEIVGFTYPGIGERFFPYYEKEDQTRVSFPDHGQGYCIADIVDSNGSASQLVLLPNGVDLSVRLVPIPWDEDDSAGRTFTATLNRCEFHNFDDAGVTYAVDTLSRVVDVVQRTEAPWTGITPTVYTVGVEIGSTTVDEGGVFNITLVSDSALPACNTESDFIKAVLTDPDRSCFGEPVKYQVLVTDSESGRTYDAGNLDGRPGRTTQLAEIGDVVPNTATVSTDRTLTVALIGIIQRKYRAGGLTIVSPLEQFVIDPAKTTFTVAVTDVP